MARHTACCHRRWGLEGTRSKPHRYGVGTAASVTHPMDRGQCLGREQEDALPADPWELPGGLRGEWGPPNIS